MGLILLPAADDARPGASPTSPPTTGAALESAELASLRVKALRGNSIAQYNLGLAYAQGASRSSSIDRVEAFVWLTLAAEGGSTGRALDDLLNQMSDADRAEGRRRLQELRAAHPALRAVTTARPKAVVRIESTPSAEAAPTTSTLTAAASRPPATEIQPAESAAAETKRLMEQVAAAGQESRQRAAEAADLRARLAAAAQAATAAAAAKSELESALAARAGELNQVRRELAAVR
ncbi:MAG: SEL1-like repeat protein, partial [Verrucomicrobia bacterium]|nr:SEL1-like repeat protein [Verrucomicrobiota bacterium]